MAKDGTSKHLYCYFCLKGTILLSAAVVRSEVSVLPHLCHLCADRFEINKILICRAVNSDCKDEKNLVWLKEFLTNKSQKC